MTRRHPVEIPAGLAPLSVLRLIVRHPVSLVVRRWNHKSAVVSAVCRAALFFAVNLSAGIDAAKAAMVTELLFRFATAGFYGAITQAFRASEPHHLALLTTLVVLPGLAHSAELVVHWLRGTAELQASFGASVIFTCVTTSFNLFAMRRGALTVGEGSTSLFHDLRRLPGLISAFALAWRSRPST